MDIRAISPGDDLPAAVSFGSRGQYRVYAFPTTHRVPSQGYAIAAIKQGDQSIDRSSDGGEGGAVSDATTCGCYPVSEATDVSIVNHVCTVM